MCSGSFRDIAHPITNEFRHFIEKVILEKYHKMVEEEESSEGADS